MDTYADAGGGVFDTPSNYRDGAGEEIVGEVLDGREDRFAVAPKYGVSRDPADPNAGLVVGAVLVANASSDVSCHQHSTREAE